MPARFHLLLSYQAQHVKFLALDRASSEAAKVSLFQCQHRDSKEYQKVTKQDVMIFLRGYLTETSNPAQYKQDHNKIIVKLPE